MINDWNFLNLGHFSPQKGTYASVMTVLEFHSVVDEIQLIFASKWATSKVFFGTFGEFLTIFWKFLV